MLPKRLTSSNQQPVSFTFNNQVEKKNQSKFPKNALLASNAFLQDFFSIISSYDFFARSSALIFTTVCESLMEIHLLVRLYIVA